MECCTVRIRKITVILFTLIASLNLLSQTYILNEDFSSASGTTPPSGWMNSTISGEVEDLWHFDNPGVKVVNYPMIGSFAIFDSEGISKNQVPENVILETPFFDATISAEILFSFDHYFVGGDGASGTIEVYDGDAWHVVKTFIDTTTNSEKEILDISSYSGSVPNSKIRFRWQGDSIGYWAIDNLSIYTPLPTDAGITTLNTPVMPFAAGTHPIEVSLANFGANTITHTTINWSVNGVQQTPYAWTGSLSSGTKESNIDIGSYSFVSGQKTVFKIWQTEPNGETDGYSLNDTLTKTLYTALCGTYTVGGNSPDFENFTEVATALNNAGVACPVIFEVRDGIYDEQIKLYEISGSSATNTITFRSESRDSSLVELHYTTSNPSNDFTLAITGSDYISFEDMSVRRTNGNNSVLIQNESNHVRFERCHLTGHVLSPNTSVDENLTLRDIAMAGYNMSLQQTDGQSAKNIVVERVSMQDLTVSNSENVTVTANQARQTHFISDSAVSILDNQISFQSSAYNSDLKGVYIYNCSHVILQNNNVINLNARQPRALEISNSKSISVLNNNITGGGRYNWSMVVYINGAESRNIVLRENIITSQGNVTRHGIYADNGDSIYISNNTVKSIDFNAVGYGISIYNIKNLLEVDNNTIETFKTRGIHARCETSNWKFTNNTIKNIEQTGIFVEKTGGVFANNTVDGVVAGNGIQLTASNTTVSENRFLNIQAGTGIIVNGPDNLVANNFVEADGVGIAKGISLQENGSGSKIVFNSINITGTDVANGVGLEVLGGDNYTVKNNIFANNGGGYAFYTITSLKGVFDYNNYYSTKSKLARFNNADYSNWNSFQAVSEQEANGLAKNPFYSSDSVLQANQVLLNDAAESGIGITSDIEAVTRGASPDFGALEYTPCSQDAGVNEFVGLVNPLSVGNQNVNVELQNQGTGVLTSAVIHWEVNGVAQTPYNWSGSLDYKDNTEITIGTFTFAGGESYKLKAWTESPNGGVDCNIYNDTAKAFDMATPMCGIYSIGGTDPDFTNFTDAAIALNNAGITCPVIFEIRDGIYDEQIKLYEISGSSATNTITFRSESRDSSLVELHYTTSNPSNDFTLAITGSDYISFEDMSVRRTNGNNSVLIQNESNHVRFERCHLTGHVLSPNTSVDENLTLRDIAMAGYNMSLQQTDGQSAKNIVVERVSMQDLTVSNSENVTVTANQARQTHFISDSAVSILDNQISFQSSAYNSDLKGVYIYNCSHVILQNNNVINLNARQPRALEISNSKSISVLNNNITGGGRYNWSMVVYINGAESRNIVLRENIITSQGNVTRHGIYADNGDSIYISNNTVKSIDFNAVGYGISIYNIKNLLEVDNNTIETFKTRGIHARCETSNWKFTNNTIKNIEQTGIFVEKTGGVFANNTVDGVVAGNGIQLTASNTTVSENRFLNIQAGTGIIVNGPDNLVANNFVEADGVGIAKGISLQENGSGSKIVFNSINITGTDVANGVGLEVLGGDNYTVKNNIFANNGGGYAFYTITSLKGVFDYNNYYSTKSKLARFNNADYSNWNSFQAVSEQEANGLAKNPFYSSDSVLQANQVLLNDAAESGIGITSDIEAVTRGASPDFGALEYTPCSQDAGVNEFVGLVNPLSVGNQNVNVELQNQGTGVLTSAVIHWEVNGVAQTPYNWSGSLDYKDNTEITIGTFTFAGGESYKLKAWTESPNGGVDCNIYNDTAKAFDMATPMCGIYSIGGTDPDFTNFTDAAIALNNAGITCPVIFEIRDGIYDEQIKLYEISGSSATNTITFRSESRDSSLVELHYTTSNPSNDFTLAITGSDYISFEDMSVRRTNGNNSVLIQNESNHVRFERCHLTGHVLSPNTSVDENLTLRDIAMAGYNMSLQQTDGQSAKNIVVERVSMQDLTVSNSENVTVTANQARQTHFISDSAVSILDNQISFQSSAYNSDLKGVYIYNCSHVILQNNNVINLNARQPRALEISNSKSISVLNNNITGGGRYNWSMVVYINGAESRNIVLRENIITSQGNVTRHGIYADNGDSIYISNNTVKSIDFNAVGYGISIYNIKNLLEVDNNTIETFKTRGIHARCETSNWKFTNNTIKNIEQTGIFVEKTGGVFANNTVDGVVAGNGIQLTASNTTVSENRFLNIQAGAGIIVNGPDNLVANNFIQAEGVGIAKGISLQENGSGSKIVFNSINITGTDVANGVGLEVLGGNNYTVKNNIFANEGGGLAAKLDLSIAGSDWDYNDFYSSGDEFGSYLGTLYSDLGSWGSAINADANSNVLNPFYLSETELRPSQRSINGAGIASSGITLDIDGEVRNQAAPDVGADEYLVDFGITQLVSPTLSCGLGDSDSVTILIRQFGDVPFIDLQVAYQVNGGTVNTGTVPGEIANDITYTFPTRENLAGHGTYDFKIWLIGSHDDNINNDTLEISRYSSDVPEVNFTFVADCAGTDIPFTGSATVANGSITNYEWLFEDGDTATVQNPLHTFATSGLYHVTLRAYTDIGCYGDTAKEVDLLATPQVAFSAEDACFGEEVVFANNSTVESGTLTFDWSFGDGESSLLASPTHPYASSGKYEVELRATASSGCTATITDSVTMFNQLHANLTTSVDTAEADVTGGLAPYTILWENGETSAMVTGLEAGWQSVTIMDANTCSMVDSVEVVIPELQISVSGIAASCAACADGSASVAIAQGVAPFYYQWSNGATTDSTSGLLPGMHYVTVRDRYLNAIEDSVFIEGSNTLSLVLDPTNLSCFNSADGAIDLTISGGMGPFSILWTHGATTEDINSLPADTYTVSVTDANGSTETAFVTLSEPEAITLNSTIQSVTCQGGNDGSIALNTIGGASPYTYLWSNGAGESSIQNLTEGGYAVDVSDANGCIVEDTFTLESTSTLVLALTTYDVSCNGNCNGVATVSVFGGKTPYTYDWSNGATGLFQFNLCGGDYSVTVSDADGCTSDSSFTIGEPEMMNLTLTAEHVSCSGADNGSVTTLANGGTAPYSFSWDNGDTTQNLSDVGSDIYVLTATDDNGCFEFDMVEVKEPEAIVVNFIQSGPSCTGISDATIDITVSGGLEPYAYQWDNGATTEDLTGLTAGNYTLTTTDVSGCEESTLIEITEPAQLTLNITSEDPACNNEANGSAEAVVSGGTAPYTYTWSNGASNSVNENLIHGIYALTVKDFNECEITGTTELVNPDPLEINLTAVNPACEGLCNGTIAVELTGGTAPYTYLWSHGATESILTDLCAGTYELTVTDANGCRVSASQELSWATVLTGSMDISDVTCDGMCNGYAIAIGAGGDGSFTYQWSDGQTGSLRSGLCENLYEVTITDGQGCTFDLSDSVTAPESIEILGDANDATCKGEANGSILLVVSGGTPEYTYQWNNGQTSQNLTAVAAGSYIVNVRDANGCNAIANYTLSEPADDIIASGTETDVSCHGEANGSIVVSVAGGMEPYQYAWSNGSTAQDLTDLMAGEYSVEITDANACSFAESFTVTEPVQAITATGFVTEVSCHGETSGSIALTVTGGTAPYQFAWSNGSTAQDLTDLMAGVYLVTITDANGCSLDTEFTVSEPDEAISATGIVTNVNCSGENNGSIILTVSGGTAPYQFIWSNGSSNQNLNDLTAGEYQVTITDANGCSFAESFTLTEPAEALSTAGTPTDVSCHGEAIGAIALTVTGGTAPYQFTWSNGSTTQDLTDLRAGDYSVEITDANACSFAESFTVTEPVQAITATGFVTEVSCHGEAIGAIALTVTGGTAPYQFTWSNGSTTQDLTDLRAGDYSVEITDANACSFAESFTVTEPVQAITATGFVTEVSCHGETSGSIALTVTGGTAPYQFAWSNGSTTRDQSYLMAGAYQVTVTDANGCSSATEFTVTEPEESLSASGIASEADCSGEASGSISLFVTGGTPPYQYSWSNGSTTQNLTGLLAGMYHVTITDANGCMTYWTGEVQAQSKAVLSGYARHSKGYVTADEAAVVLYDASIPHNRAVAEVRTGPDGSFSFVDIPEGQYILHVKLDNHDKKTYHGVMSSYYGNTYKWQEAEIIALSCEDNESIIVDMFENPAATNGNGKVGGKVSHEPTSLKSLPVPVIDAQVLLIDESNGLPVSFITTDDNGNYIITDVAVGDYSIYVDIPGITQKTTHYFSITESQLEIMDLDFVVDAVRDLDINSVLNTYTPEISQILNSVNIFPNPTISDYIILQSDLLDRKKVEVVIISDVGSIMLQRDIYVTGDRIKLDLYGFVPGNYILRMKLENEVQYKKFIVLRQ